MFQQPYTYNPDTCSYERYELKGKALRNRVLLLITLSVITGALSYVAFINTNKPVDVQKAETENQHLKTNWYLLNDKLAGIEKKVKVFAEEDDKNYRVILDQQPLSLTERQAGVGGALRKPKAVEEYPFINTIFNRAQRITNQLVVQNESYENLQKLVASKNRQWSSRPAIQPIENKKLVHLYGTFGMRLNPVLGIWRPHKGLDFKALRGTPIYATGDGVVADAYYSGSYGNVVYINHGFNFETRYAHMQQYIVAPGEQVKRGQVIGYVGSTGTSAGEHLHYEVLYNNEQINPINFFQRDLSNKEYQKLLLLAKKENKSLD